MYIFISSAITKIHINKATLQYQYEKHEINCKEKECSDLIHPGKHYNFTLSISNTNVYSVFDIATFKHKASMTPLYNVQEKRDFMNLTLSNRKSL